VVALLASLLAIGPIIWLLLTSFKVSAEVYTVTLTLFPKRWVLENYLALARNADYVAYGRNSVIISFAGTVVTVAISALAAFAFSRYRFRDETPCSWLCSSRG